MSRAVIGSSTWIPANSEACYEGDHVTTVKLCKQGLAGHKVKEKIEEFKNNTNFTESDDISQASDKKLT